MPSCSRMACAGALITVALAMAAAQTQAQRHSGSMDHASEDKEMQPTGIAVALPTDPAEVCAAKVQRKATYCSERYDFWRGEDLDEEEQQHECCRSMAAYFGTNATENGGRGANCFCVDTVWEETLKREEISQTDYASSFDKCKKLGHPILYYQDGGGPCMGLVAEKKKEEGDDEEHGGGEKPDVLPPVKSFRGWLRSLPADNPVLIFAILITIPSVAGFSTVVVWPLTYFSVLESMRLSRVMRSRWNMRKIAA